LIAVVASGIALTRKETDDTPFRLYRESNPALKTSTWISIAGTIEEVQAVAKDLEEEDASRHAIALKDKILAAIPRFEEGEIVRITLNFIIEIC
jgi:hypothetical protein